MSTDLRWRKSSYSGDQGNCVEVAVWAKSSYSGDQGGDCVEVAVCAQPAVHVRDSKDTAIPALTVSPQAWATLLDGLAAAPRTP